jgi:secondary thiamine-phosphate synthase enzyme
MLCRQTLTAETRDRVELIDLTDQVREFVRGLSIQEGLISVCSQHTTCAVFVTENQTALKADIVRLLEALAPRSAGWLHNDPVHSDCDRRNGDSHLRAILLGQGVTLQIHESEVALGEWQRVLLGELDGPRTRTVFIQASGLQWNGLELLAAPRVFRGGEVGSPPLTERGRSAAPGRGGEVGSPPLTERGRSATPGGAR